MRQFLIFAAALSFTLPLCARPASGVYASPDVDELRIELDDLKFALHTTQVELGLLDERLKKQNTTSTKNDTRDSSTLSLLTATVSSLEKKVSHLEKVVEKTGNDLRTLSTSLTQSLNKIQNLESDLSAHDKRFEEVSKLKGTLTTISKTIGQRSSIEPASSPTKSYRVKAGDSLEKIARHHQITVDSLRKINHLANDKIVVGQDLRIPDDAG